jgi:16S rRNA (cytosine967-C5)-methyltransferase
VSFFVVAVKYITQIKYIRQLLISYDGLMPLYIHVKRFFRKHPEMGSRDRKIIKELTFHYFRLNKAFGQYDTDMVILLSHLICAGSSGDFITYWAKEKKIDLPVMPDNLTERIAAIQQMGYECKLEKQFPAIENISKQINRHSFLLSHLKQPHTWIRCKQSKKIEVINELREKEIDFFLTTLSDNAVCFKKHYDLSKLQSYQNGWFEIQDLSSQLTGNFFMPRAGENWWDCCAASGGKSLLLKDLQPDIDLTVSDSRPAILKNLKQRFSKAQVNDYQCLLIDLERDAVPFQSVFDGIIADVPCTGSGTWARSPERMTFFNEKEIAYYAERQKRILTSVIPHLKPGGKLIYITCSVYADENENIIEYLINNFNLKLEDARYLKGYEYQADTLFAARLVN